MLFIIVRRTGLLWASFATTNGLVTSAMQLALPDASDAVSRILLQPYAPAPNVYSTEALLVTLMAGRAFSLTSLASCSVPPGGGAMACADLTHSAIRSACMHACRLEGCTHARQCSTAV